MQQTEDYFVWDTDPIVFTIPQWDLPVPIYTWGLILGAVLIYFGWQKYMPSDTKKRVSVPVWKPWGIILGGLIAAQLPFLLIGGPTLDSIGPIEPRWYGLMFASAFIFGYLLGQNCSGMVEERRRRSIFF